MYISKLYPDMSKVLCNHAYINVKAANYPSSTVDDDKNSLGALDACSFEKALSELSLLCFVGMCCCCRHCWDKFPQIISVHKLRARKKLPPPPSQELSQIFYIPPSESKWALLMVLAFPSPPSHLFHYLWTKNTWMSSLYQPLHFVAPISNFQLKF